MQIREVNLRIHSKYGKMRTRKNSAIICAVRNITPSKEQSKSGYCATTNDSSTKNQNMPILPARYKSLVNTWILQKKNNYLFTEKLAKNSTSCY